MLKRVVGLTLGLLVSMQSAATVVEVRTSLGNFEVNLFDEQTPETVSNFLEYANAGAYANNIIHRSISDFVIQGGGFQYNNALPLDLVITGTPVQNEPVLSNVRGTISMAKLEGDPNSATSQWFINLSDNSQNLDTQNGGFSAFGQVLGNGMEVVDAIAALPTFDFGGATNSIPLDGITVEDLNNGTEPNEDNFVIIFDVVVTDENTVTNPQLSPALNTVINDGNSGNEQPPVSTGGSSGGAISVLPLFAGLILLAWRRRK